ncbi:MAG: hypothetical protein ABR540_16365 [Acidimicrobiales bacterium]
MDNLRSVLGGSIAFVVLVPVLVGAVQPSPAKPEQRAAAVTVPLTGEGRWPSDTGTRYIGIVADGSPPSGPTRLVDKNGRNPVTVKPADAEKCEGMEPRATSGTAMGTWCLEVGPARLGTEVTGTLDGDATDLALTIDSRFGLLWFPAAVIFLGLAIAIALALIPARLKSMVGQARVWIEVARNGTDGTPEIKGIEEWARRRLEGGAEPAELARTISGLISTGPGKAQDARDGLGTAMEGLPADHPLREIASAEAASTHLAVEHFLDHEGKAVVHPAKTLTELVTFVKDAWNELDDIEQRIAGLKAFYQGAPRRELNAARRSVGRVTISAFADVARRDLDIAWAAYAAASANPQALEGQATEAAGGMPRAFTHWFTETASAPSADTRGSIRNALISTTAFAAVVLAAAVLSVLSSTYFGKPTFGSPVDFLSLGLAAFGSAAAGTVATIIAYWSFSASTE